MSSLARYAATGPHLDLISHLELKDARNLVVAGSTAYVSAAEKLHVIDVTDPAAPRVRSILAFKNHIGSLALSGTTLLVGEYDRAMNLVDVSDPARPDNFDCVLSFGVHFYQTAIAGDLAVSAINWEGVGLMDVSDPRKARWLDRVKLDEGFVEHLALAGDRIFAAGASGGLRVFAAEKGKLVEVARPCGAGFNASQVHAVGDRVWVFGTPEEPKKGGRKRRGEHELIVIDPAKPDRVECTLDLDPSPPRGVLPLPNGAGVGFSGYRWYAYAPREAWAAEIFGQFTRDDDGAYVERKAKRAGQEEAAAGDEGEVVPDEDSSRRETSCMADLLAAKLRGEQLWLLRSDGLWVHALRDRSIFST